MGSNKRHGSDVSREAINEFLIRPRPISLSEAERGRQETVELTTPEPTFAWVRYPEFPIRVRAYVVERGEKIALVRWKLRNGAEHQAWVWADALDKPGDVDGY